MYCIMGKIYTVVFTSAIGEGTANDENFYFDWSRIEEGKYKCQFTFMSAVPTVAPTMATVPVLFMDLGQGAYTTIASTNLATSPDIGAVFSPNYIGCLETRTFTSGGISRSYYYAGTTTNTPFFIDNKPRNNNVRILMLENDADLGTLYVPVPNFYTLTLQLEKLLGGYVPLVDNSYSLGSTAGAEPLQPR